MGWSNTQVGGFGAPPPQNTQWAPLNPLGGGGGGGGSNQVRVVNGQLQPVGGGGSQPDAGGTLRDRIFGEYQKQLNTYNQGVQNDQRSIEGLLGGRGVNIPQPGNMPGQQPLGQQQRGSNPFINPDDGTDYSKYRVQAGDRQTNGNVVTQRMAQEHDQHLIRNAHNTDPGFFGNPAPMGGGSGQRPGNMPGQRGANLSSLIKSFTGADGKLDEAGFNAANEAFLTQERDDSRKAEIERVLGYSVVKNQNGGYMAQNAMGGYGITQNQYGGGNLSADHPWYSAQASPVMANLVRNGLAGTTAGQNQVVLSNSLALADKSMQDQRLQMEAQQQQYTQGAEQQRFQESQNQFALNRGDNLTRDAVNYYKERNSVPPDISPLLQMAQMEGQGATDGMQQPQSGGWGGGGFMSGYNIPQGAWGAMGAYYQEPQQGQQMSAQEQLASVQDQQRTAAANRDLQLTLMGQQQEQIRNMPGTAQARARAQRQFNQQWGV